MMRKYSAQDLIDAVKTSLSSSEASKQFNVPERTIRSHRQNQSQKIGAGRNRYLDDEQEEYLVSFFKLLPEYGFTLSSDIAIKVAGEYIKSIGLSLEPGRKWLRSFIRRHQTEIKWRKEEKLEQIRAKKFTEEIRRSWFSLLKSVLLKLDLMDKPVQIFNCDETGFSDKTNRKHVIVTSSVRHVFEKDGGGGKQYTTALIAIGAGGQVISPFIIYGGKILMNTWCRGGPDGARYAVTKKGWIDSSSFEFWLREMFITATAHLNRPLLLIMDGHNAHVNINIIQLMQQEKIVCLILPPHCTHGLQPVDIVLFNNVKTDWSSIVRNHFKSGNKSIKNSDIPRLMKRLFFEKQSFSTTLIVSSFSRAGIWPFNENTMMDKVVNSSLLSTTSVESSNQSTSIPKNLLIPPLIPSSGHTSSPTTSLLGLLMTSEIPSRNPDVNMEMLVVDDIVESADEILFDVQQIKAIKPITINDPEFPTSTESILITLKEFDFSTSVLNLHTDIEKIMNASSIDDTRALPMTGQDPANRHVIEPIDAVREVMIGLLAEHQQHHSNSIHTTIVRGSRLNNTTGVNITEECFLQMMKAKTANEAKSIPTKKRKLSKPTTNRSKRTSKDVIGIHSDNDQENDESMEYEYEVRKQLDFVIEQTEMIFDITDPDLL